MKKNEIPQDDGPLKQAGIRELCYAVDENGVYTTELSSGWSPKTEALANTLDFINEKAQRIQERIADKELSPIAYFMETKYMNARLLGQYVGISAWRVKRHMQYKHFVKLNDNVLRRYAEAFGISLPELRV